MILLKISNLRKLSCYLLLLISLGAFLACNTNQRPDSNGKVKGLIDIDLTEVRKKSVDFPLSRLVSDVDFVQLESTVESWCTMLSSISLSEHYIIVAAEVEKKVLLFRRSGQFIRQIGRCGKGPGEYQYPNFAAIDPDEKYIVVKDASGGNLFKYNLSGDLLKQVDILSQCPTSVKSQPVFLDEKHFALSFNRPAIPVDNHFNVAVFDEELKLVERMIPIPNDTKLTLTLLHNQQLSQGSDFPFYYENFVDTLYAIQPGRKPVPKYHFIFGENHLPLEFLNGHDRVSHGIEFSMLLKIIDLPGYLVLSYLDKEFYQVIYSKGDQDVFTSSDKPVCNSGSGRLVPEHPLENDLFGYDPIWLSHYFPDQNLLVYPLSLDEAAEITDLDCLRKKRVLLPEKRDQLVKMIENYRGDELPLLVFMSPSR